VPGGPQFVLSLPKLLRFLCKKFRNPLTIWEGCPLFLGVPPISPQSQDTHPTHKCKSPYFKKWVVPVQRWFDLVHCHINSLHLKHCQMWVFSKWVEKIVHCNEHKNNPSPISWPN
jgi:hypothetical protein